MTAPFPVTTQTCVSSIETSRPAKYSMFGLLLQKAERSNPQWRDEFQTVLPDLIEDDISGSGFAITAYTVGEMLGGERALAQFRQRLARRGIKPMLDFVPNHTHPTISG